MIKLTGGNLRGRTIKTITGITTRPSSAKVRESIFNIMAEQVIDSSWLDLFGGTGAVGLEALSRGARKVTFVENDFSALNCLKKNILLFNLADKTLLLKQDSLTFLKNCRGSFDHIFLDPPYLSDYYEKVFTLINKNPSLLNPNGILIVEHKTKTELPDILLNKGKSYKYGDTGLTFYYKD